MTFIDNCKDCGCSKELCCKQETVKQIFKELDKYKKEGILYTNYEKVKTKFLQEKNERWGKMTRLFLVSKLVRLCCPSKQLQEKEKNG